ncbi:GNAT family N-acetyltransferase [Loktanella sp. S4079]|uniref:GNAT family N-acetyltransferase n=1 Tax=Loktanella sp. S4079 TaxID=579483 RepID=UPI0005F9E13C|nr:GNAT family N-acetyltransferase [Loktanella sp. S4079]KJZ19350.1 hypothetical protein TW80_11305 [Loktanella sp. S4079]
MIIRPARNTDAPDMTALLNEIIGIGGSTAHETPFDQAKMLAHYIACPNLISCQVAEESDQVRGFQWLGWATDEDAPVPSDWGIIASFVAPNAAGKGIGQQLFSATQEAARAAGAVAIDATIRADNVAGLRYYTGLGFRDYDRLIDIPLSDGTKVDRIRKRYDL